VKPAPRTSVHWGEADGVPGVRHGGGPVNGFPPSIILKGGRICDPPYPDAEDPEGNGHPPNPDHMVRIRTHRVRLYYTIVKERRGRAPPAIGSHRDPFYPDAHWASTYPVGPGGVPPGPAFTIP
jgi:hypothetical protein